MRRLDPLLLDACYRLAESVAGELLCDPLYVCGPADLAHGPFRFGGPIEKLGFATKAEEYLADVLPGWRGPGRLIGLDVVGHWLAYGTGREHVLASLLHELAHLLPVRPLRKPPRFAPPEKLHTMQLAWLQADEARSIELRPPDELPWQDDDTHGWRFIRRALHLWSRATAAGWQLPIRNLCAGESYQLSPAADYLAALNNEPAHFGGESFATIEAATPPPAFADLWRADTQTQIENQR